MGQGGEGGAARFALKYKVLAQYRTNSRKSYLCVMWHHKLSWTAGATPHFYDPFQARGLTRGAEDGRRRVFFLSFFFKGW